MRSDILMLKKNALRLGLCGEYKAKWDNARGKKDLVDIALDSNGVEWICQMAEMGVLTKEIALSDFGNYINGKYVRNKGGYTSEVYAYYDGTVTMRTTLLVVMGCDVEVIVPENSIGRIYTCCGAKVRVTGKGKAEVITPGRMTSQSKQSV